MGAPNQTGAHWNSSKCENCPFLDYYEYLIRTNLRDEKSFISSLLSLSEILNYEENFLHEQRSSEHLLNAEKALLKRKQFKLKQSIAHLRYLQSEHCKLDSIISAKDVIEAVKGMIAVDIDSVKEQEAAILYALVEEEYRIFRELHCFRVEGYLQDPKVHKYAPRSNDFDLPFEILDFQDFVLSSGGHLGGWNEKDHYKFLKLREKCKQKTELLKLTLSVPYLTDKVIYEHDIWYEEYMRKKKRRDAAIASWKKEKQYAAESHDVQISTPTKTKNMDNKHLLVKEKLRLWKEDCMRSKDQETKVRELQKAMDEKKAKEKFEKHRLQLKEKLRKYGKQKEANQVVLNYDVKQLKQDKQRDVKQMIKITQMRDEISRIEKKEQELAKCLCEVNSQLKLQSLRNRVKVCIPNDPGRVLKATKSWTERKLCAGSSDVEKPAYLPRRHIPTWRKVMQV